jgi:ferrochelatase
VCYQSRVGPLKWLAPSIDDEIARAAADEIGVCVVPIAFVSEHSETLVELDVEYRKRADAEGVPAYVRAATVDTDAAFIAGLAGLIRGALDDARAVAPGAGHAGCPANWRKCACRAAGKTGD